MKKILFLLLLTIAGYGQTSTGQEQEFDYGIKNNSTQTITTPTYLTTTGTDGTQGKIPSAYIEKTADKISTISGYSETSYPNEKAAHDALDLKLNISDLPTNLTLYPTNVASDVGGYVKMVTDIHDADYNTVAVDVSTPTITGTAQLVSQRISAPGVLIGQPGVFNITTFGNIKRLSGTGTANFYFEVYHRNLAGTETLICTSSVSDVVSLSTYSEFTASGIWNDGDFIATDRIVIKTYANRIAGGTDPVYQFQFGGTQPVRTLLPVPFSVVDAGYEMSANKQNSLAIDGTGTKYPTVDAVNAALPVTYSTVVYVNSTSPNTATIFDDVNPPVVNDPLLEDDTDNLYIGNDASTWVYNGSTYVTKIVPATSNFYIENTNIDAGNNKDVVLQRVGGISSESAITSKKGMSDTVNLGSTFRLFNSGSNTGNIFQLNASNGVDIWNLADGNWNKRFTFFGNGNLRQHSTVSNTEHIVSAPNNTPILSFLGADNSRPIFGYKGLAFRIGSVTGEGAAGLTEQLQLFANGNLILQNGGDFIDNGNRLQVTGSISATSYTGSATLTNAPTAPTAAPGTNTTQIATTAFVQGEISTSARWTASGNDIYNSNSGNIGIGTSAVPTKAKFEVKGEGGTGAIASFNNNGNVERFRFEPDGSFKAVAQVNTPQISEGSGGAILKFNIFPNYYNFTTELPINLSVQRNVIGIIQNFTNSSGSEALNLINLSPTINQTGTSTSIMRSLYINPTLTSVVDFRAIEVTAGDTRLQKVIANNVIRLKNYTVATLPAGTQGDTAYVTDATAPTYLGTLIGGGAVVCPVFYNGTAWVSH